MRRAIGATVALLVVVAFALPAQDVPDAGTDATPIVIDTGGATDTPEVEPAPFDPGAVFVNANTAYEEGDWERAVELYSALLAHGLVSAQVHYDLGNAFLRNGELGRAIAAYRRSQALQPRGQDLHANLEFARRATKDALAPPQPSVLVATLLFWHHGLSRTELAVATVVLNLLLWSVLALRLYRRGSELLRWTFMILLLLTLAVGGSLVARHAFPTRVAVVIPAEVDALTGPDAEAVVRFKLHAGTEVRVKDWRDGWLRIALPDGQQGWVSADHLEVVEL